MKKLGVSERAAIALAFERDLEPAASLAKRFGVTRQTIYNALRKAGIDLKRSGWVPRVCGHCGAKIRARRSVARLNRQNYCDAAHYHAQLATSGYTANRQGQRIARRVVGDRFALKPTHVVHHVNGDQSDNAASNLMVFNNQAEHMRWHRAGGSTSGVVPLWCGGAGGSGGSALRCV